MIGRAPQYIHEAQETEDGIVIKPRIMAIITRAGHKKLLIISSYQP